MTQVARGCQLVFGTDRPRHFVPKTKILWSETRSLYEYQGMKHKPGSAGKVTQEKEDRALEAIMCVCLRADRERWTKKRWDSFWKKVYEKRPPR